MDPKELHRNTIIIDGLNVSKWSPKVLKDINEGGVTAFNATIAILENFRQTISNLAQWENLFNGLSDIICPARNVDDILEAKKNDKTGVIFGFQNSSPIEDDLDLLIIFHGLGVRIIQLAYMEGNYVGSGCLERVDGGITNFGIEMIEEMNRLGILIDLSHVGYKTSMDALKFSNQPVALTHANPISLVSHKRNKPDDLLKAVADTGGVVGATTVPSFVKQGGEAELSDFIRIIDYLVNLVGIDHVGIGTDFFIGQTEEWTRTILSGKSKKGPKDLKDYPHISFPKGIQTPRDYPNITAALVEQNYSETDVRKVLGENFLRVFTEVWR